MYESITKEQYFTFANENRNRFRRLFVNVIVIKGVTDLDDFIGEEQKFIELVRRAFCVSLDKNDVLHEGMLIVNAAFAVSGYEILPGTIVNDVEKRYRVHRDFSKVEADFKQFLVETYIREQQEFHEADIREWISRLRSMVFYS